MIYAAYGANTNVTSMKARCPDAKPLGSGIILDHALAFNGVASIVAERGAECAVALWDISLRDEKSLDQFEGYPRLYFKKFYDVQTDDGVVRAMGYYMTPRKLEEPSFYYESTLRTGYNDFGMPQSQIDLAIKQAMETGDNYAFT